MALFFEAWGHFPSGSWNARLGRVATYIKLTWVVSAYSSCGVSVVDFGVFFAKTLVDRGINNIAAFVSASVCYKSPPSYVS
jgi:hypothetical protein